MNANLPSTEFGRFSIQTIVHFELIARTLANLFPFVPGVSIEH